MTRSERLGVVQQATAHVEREHADRVAQAERHVVAMEEKLARSSVTARNTKTDSPRARAPASASPRGGISRPSWRVSAMRSSSNARSSSRRAPRTRLTVQVWREAAKRAHVVDTLAERWQVEETREEDRRDQRDSDELSQQLRFRNREGKT